MANTRESLWQALCAAGGQFCSGQALADTLGISRAAVHKAALSLQKEGWHIEAVRRRGYRLTDAGDVLRAEAAGALPGPVYVYDALESTNRTAKQLALDPEKAPHGTLILAGRQTAGRGRLGRSFVSPAGGVYMTLLLRPALSAVDALAVTGSAAVAVCRAVRRLCGRELAIKWVNDLFWHDKKVCGILTEASTDLESGRVEWIAVGIGLNLTTAPAELGPELADIAGSLYPEGPAPVGRAQLAGEIARTLLEMCPAFDYLAEYRARCFVPGHWVTVRGDGAPYAARALAIDDQGRLVVETAAGRQLALQHGEVSVRPALL